MAEADKKSKGQKIIERNKHLEDDRQSWLTHWQNIKSYVLPRHGRFISVGAQANQGIDRHTKIFDSTAIKAIKVLAAGMQGGLTSPARPWFRLGFEDVELMTFGPVKDWVDMVERVIYGVYARSNLYSAIHSVYRELAGFDTACLFIDEDPINFIRLRVFTAGEYCLALDKRGELDTAYFRFWMQVRQVVQKFGLDRVSDVVKRVYENKPYEFIQIVHAIQPRKDREPGKLDNLGMPWESVYVEYANPKETLEISGYNELPVAGPRWDIVGSDVYGTGVGRDALAPTMMLQELQKSSIKAIHKEIEPPMRVPSNYNRKLKMFPAAVNKIDVNQNDAVSKLFDFDFDIASTEAKIINVQNEIKEIFYNDLFRLIADAGAGSEKMTATEVLEKKEEKLILLGPVIERQIHELLDPLIDRTFAIGMRNRWFPPPPLEIQGMDLKIEYISLLAQAQKLAVINTIDSMVGFVGNVTELYPDAPDKIDIDKAIDERAEAIGSPSRIIRPDNVVEEMRRARSKVLEAQEAMEGVAEAAQVAKTLSEADLGKDSALKKVTEVVTGD